MFINCGFLNEIMEITEAKKILQKLIDLYHNYKDDKSFIGNEKQACQSLIIPLIRDILHWNTDNPAEFKTEVSQSGKRIDYVVCNNGISQFIVEAKAPIKDIFDDEDYYKQALAYGYGKQKDFAILTNFKQVVILACQVQWRVPREAELARLELLTAKDEDIGLLLAFEKEHWATAGKENILYSRLLKHTKTIPVDVRLLEDMKYWRERLLSNIQENSRFNRFDFEDKQEFMHIEEEIQRFIDRFIFICFCEDKEIHEPHLKQLMLDKNERFSLKPGWLLDKIQEIFVEYRRIYDSDLFDKGDCDEFKIDDAKILVVIEQLREPKGKVAYDFKSIEADILGKTYENFIGHVQTGKKRFKEKEDFGKRKREGIYYTPRYIVDYIINNTIREYLQGKSFEGIKKVKILDPACGSGSFLRVAFDVLVEESEKVLKRSLTYEEKKELLLNCIFGVDLDERAVEIAKFNLSLKMAEGGKSLPVLRENIRVGNSLIEDKAIAGYKAFIWKEEFKEIMEKGGFDVVVGNPPYVNNRNLPKKEKAFIEENYKTAYQQYDLYVLFYELAFKLVKEGGYIGLITPNKFAITKYGFPLRKLLLDYTILKVVDVSQLSVFGDVSTYPYIVILQKVKSKTNSKIKMYSPSSFELEKSSSQEIKQSELIPEKQFIFNINSSQRDVISKIEGDRVIEIYRAKPTSKDINNSGECLALTNKDIRKYGFNPTDNKIKRRKEWLIGVPAILLKKICFVPTATLLNNDKYIPVNTIYVIHSKDRKIKMGYLLGILNSKVIAYYTRTKYGLTAMRGGFIELRTFEIEDLPIKTVPEPQQQPLIRLVDKILSLNKRLNELKDKSPDEKIKIEAEIKKTDCEIDELVYKLYGITEEEKKIVKESLK